MRHRTARSDRPRPVRSPQKLKYTRVAGTALTSFRAWCLRRLHKGEQGTILRSSSIEPGGNSRGMLEERRIRHLEKARSCLLRPNGASVEHATSSAWSWRVVSFVTEFGKGKYSSGSEIRLEKAPQLHRRFHPKHDASCIMRYQIAAACA